MKLICKEYPNPIIDKKEKEIEMGRIVGQIYSKTRGINPKELLLRLNYMSNQNIMITSLFFMSEIQMKK